MMKIKVLGVAIAAMAIYSCASKQVVQTSKTEDTTKKAVELTADQAHGKGLFEANCGKCHKLFEPSKHDPEGWKVTLARMQKKAKISDEETASIYNYLTAGM